VYLCGSGLPHDYHAFITDRAGETLILEADHRRHAEIENAIRDLKYGMGLNHLPSGRFAANGAWLAIHVTAHNLARCATACRNLVAPVAVGPAGWTWPTRGAGADRTLRGADYLRLTSWRG
jgi:hypothetical protein